MIERFKIDADIHRATTPPGSFYRSEQAFDLSRERIFARSWQYVGDAIEHEQPGWGAPTTLLPGMLDEPLLLQTDAGGTAHCLSNVCTHRANLVVNEPGQRSSLRCGYHGRTFDLQGKFVSMPCFKGVADFPAASDSLPQLPLERWGPLLFTALGDPLCPFEQWLGTLSERLQGLPRDQLLLDSALTRDFDVACHWALYVENYLEGFHIPFVHAGLNAAIEWDSYETERLPWGVLQTASAKPDEVAFERPEKDPDSGRRVAAYYYWLFPNLMLNFYPWGLSLNLVEPQSVRQCRVRYRVYVWNHDLREQGAGSSLDAVELEDEAIVEQVQRGVQSRLYDRGRLSPQQEVGCHQFHRLLAATLFPSPTDDS